MLIRALNSIPVNRSQLDLATLRTVLKVLKDGHPLLVFPEGTRSEDGSLGEGKKEWVCSWPNLRFRCCPPDFRIVRNLGQGQIFTRIGRKLRVRYGTLLNFEELDPGGKGGERYDEISQSVMTAISRIE